MDDNLNANRNELAALADAVNGDRRALKWLMDNNSELAALADAINGDRKAIKWLVENNDELAALADAINGKPKAIKWLLENNEELAALADAVNGNRKAITWLSENNEELAALAGAIKGDRTDFNSLMEKGSYEHDISFDSEDTQKYIFKSAITRGGAVLTPDIITIDEKSVTYKKRKKNLITSDSISIPISKISSVELDTNIVGTDIIIKSFGAGQIHGKDFTKSDANEIKRIIEDRLQ